MTTVPRPKRWFRSAVLAFVAVAWLWGLVAPWTALADGQETAWRLDVHLDRSAVPGWVRNQEVTLILPVAHATEIYAWGDGAVLPVFFDAESEMARVTTDAETVTWAIMGSDVTADDLGTARLATLRDDKDWVFSLTFDDGERTVYTHARPELDHYGFDAGVAVIGKWLDPLADPVAAGYCSREEISELWGDGWGVFNHSYWHWNAGSNITADDAERCQQMVDDLLGYRPTVFTAPYTNELWQEVIDSNLDTLGLYVLQLYADGGERLMVVDEPLIPKEQAAYHMARRDIKLWQDDLYNYFDQAHDAVPQHAWVSLHGHNVAYDEDWYAVSDALAYVHSQYGLAGTDEVWVAPVDDVVDYLVTGSMSRLDAQDPKPLDPQLVTGEPWPAPQRIVLRQGTDGQGQWADTTIDSWYPDQSYGSDPVLTLRGDGQSALLLKPPMPDLGDVDVLRASLTLFARSQGNRRDLDMSVVPLTRTWDADTATWRQASAGLLWSESGAKGDFAESPIDVVHTGRSDLAMRSFTFDITDQVTQWLVDPSSNYGVLVHAEDDQSKQIRFASTKEIMYPAQMPVLVIQYQTKAIPSRLVEPTPTPGVQLRLPLIVR